MYKEVANKTNRILIIIWPPRPPSIISLYIDNVFSSETTSKISEFSCKYDNINVDLSSLITNDFGKYKLFKINGKHQGLKSK
jgi:hypothetical protein